VVYPWPDVIVDTTVVGVVCEGITGGGREMAEIRSRLRKWATGVGLPADYVDDLELASYEALANAVEHAYPVERPQVDLAAVATQSRGVLVTVRDHGQWRPPPPDPGFRGRGLVMIRALAHRSEVVRTATGTTVHMEWFGPASP
jgi:anti-sigma regulatory factor (Ser/Thr protein kinase)